MGLGVLVFATLLPGQFTQEDKGTYDSQNSSAIAIKPASIDFGDIVQGDTAESKVRISNVTGHNITLEVQKSCGCTSAELDNADLVAGESTTLRITMNTSLKTGPFREMVFVSSREDPGDKVMVPVYGRAKWVIDVTPDKVLFGEVRHRSEAFRQFILRSRNGEHLLVKTLAAATNSVTVTLVYGSDTQVVVAVSLRADAKPGEIRDIVGVVLKSPIERTVMIPVSGFYTGELSAQPPELSSNELTDENWREMVLQAKIQQRDGKNFAIKTLSCSDARFTAVTKPIGSISPDARADSFLLTVAMASNISETAEAVVRIEGDCSQDGGLEIPIHVSRGE